MPFILRQVEGHGGDIAYQYIGQAYVHGIMDGRLWKSAETWSG